MHTSWLFRAVWAIISPFLDEKTRSKVKVLAKYVVAIQAYVDRVRARLCVCVHTQRPLAD